jgi:hypothetical protein
MDGHGRRVGRDVIKWREPTLILNETRDWKCRCAIVEGGGEPA